MCLTSSLFALFAANKYMITCLESCVFSLEENGAPESQIAPSIGQTPAPILFQAWRRCGDLNPVYSRTRNPMHIHVSSIIIFMPV